MAMPPIPRPYLTLVSQLFDAGGAAELDRHGHPVVGPTRAIIAGNSAAWLYLVACGVVGGEGGKLILTEAGRELAQTYKNGRTRTAHAG